MSGNSSGDPMAAINNNVPAQTPPWMTNVAPQTMPQAMPGQIEALARQLQAGYGGRTQDFMRELDRTYDPVQSMKFNGTPKKPTTTPKTAAPKPMDPWTPITMHDGTTKPAWMTSLVQQTGMPRTPPPGRR